MKMLSFRAIAPTILAFGLLAAATTATTAATDLAPFRVAQAEKPGGAGVLNTVDTAKRVLNITHGPIAALKWPGMTMDFNVAPGLDLSALKPGGKVSFTLARGGDGMYVIDEIKSAQ